MSENNGINNNIDDNKETGNKETGNGNKENKNKETNKKEESKITAVKNAVVRTVASVGTEVSAVASTAKNKVIRSSAKPAARSKDVRSKDAKQKEQKSKELRSRELKSKELKSKEMKNREKTETAPASDMAEEQDIVETKDGKIAIDIRVIEEFAGHAALDCFGIVGMCNVSMRDGIAKLLTGNSISKGVSVTREEDGTLVIDYHIIVAYGVSIQTVVSNLINTVKYQIEDYTNKRVKAINVYVEGVRVID